MIESRIPKEFEMRLCTLTLALYRVTDFFPARERIRIHLREKADNIVSEVIEYGYARNNIQTALSIIAKVETIKRYLEIAHSLNVVHPANLKVLRQEYDSVLHLFTKELEKGNKEFIHKEEEKNAEETVHFPLLTKVEYEGIWEGDARVQKNATGAALTSNPQENSYRERTGNNMDRIGSAGTYIPLNERQRKIIEYIQNTTRAKISDFQLVLSDISLKTIQRDLQNLVGRNILKKEGEKRWTIYKRTR